MKKEDNKPKKPRKQTKRHSLAQLARINKEILQMLGDLNTNKDICKVICQKYETSESWAYRLIEKAQRQFVLAESEDINTIREQHKGFLLKNIKQCLSEKKHKSAQGWYSHLVKLYPNELQPILEGSDKTIKITFVKEDSSDNE